MHCPRRLCAKRLPYGASATAGYSSPFPFEERLPTGHSKRSIRAELLLDHPSQPERDCCRLEFATDQQLLFLLRCFLESHEAELHFQILAARGD